MTTGFDGSIYAYDAQNRVISATLGAATMTFTYDGLNRQVKRTRTLGDSLTTTTYSVWDGWDLIEEYQSGNDVTVRYLIGPSGVIKNLTSNNYYFQDGSGSTSHLTNSIGTVLEWYLYDLQGTPLFLDPNGNGLSDSAFGVRNLFTGQQWYTDIGLYDLRNRFYSPDIGRFLQPDPIGFRGDQTNLYRYGGNNPVTGRDPFGLGSGTPPTAAELGNEYTYEEVVVFGAEVPDYSGTGAPGGGGSAGGGGSGEGGGPGGRGRHGRFFQGIELPGGDFLDTLPQDSILNNGQQEIVRAPAPGESYYPPGVFPPGYVAPVFQFVTSGSSRDPFLEWLFTDSRGNSGAWLEKHVSRSINVNRNVGGGSLDFSSSGVYLGGGVGLGAGNEYSATVNLNFGTQPQGLYTELGGAYGTPFVYRFSFGWAPDTGLYGSIGFGLGYAKTGGLTLPGYGGYIYQPWRD
jgi:RHS repeat-associated protein